MMKTGRRSGYVAWVLRAGVCALLLTGSACSDSTAPRLPPPTDNSDTTTTGNTTGLRILPATDEVVRV